MNQLLSVNCVFVSAIHRLYGSEYFAIVCQNLWNAFYSAHQDPDSQSKVKNILNCFLHFFLFQSVTAQVIFGIVKFLLNSFKEDDIETLIFLLHNIGL
jgi:hypothetical protein